MDEQEPLPRGSAEWYAWAERNPTCCRCGKASRTVKTINTDYGSGDFCPECEPVAVEFMEAMEDDGIQHVQGENQPR